LRDRRLRRRRELDPVPEERRAAAVDGPSAAPPRAGAREPLRDPERLRPESAVHSSGIRSRVPGGGRRVDPLRRGALAPRGGPRGAPGEVPLGDPGEVGRAVDRVPPLRGTRDRPGRPLRGLPAAERGLAGELLPVRRHGRGSGAASLVGVAPGYPRAAAAGPRRRRGPAGGAGAPPPPGALWRPRG